MVVLIGFIGLTIAALLGLMRLWKGPRIFDRLIAFDCLGVSFVGMMALFGILNESPHFVDVILVFSLLNFLTTVIFAGYLKRKYETGSQESMQSLDFK